MANFKRIAAAAASIAMLGSLAACGSTQTADTSAPAETTEAAEPAAETTADAAAEEANKIGYETAMRWTKGQHAFIVATHVDKAHIHNHIIYRFPAISQVIHRYFFGE